MKNIKLVSLILVVVMLLAMIPVGILPTAAEEVKADEGWYARETTDADPTVLHIKNAAELLAFATELNSGTNTNKDIAESNDFAGYTGNIFYNMTIELEADIILNEGWDAMAIDPLSETRQEPETKWPVEAEKYFAGTFDGNGHVISGLYQSYLGKYVGLFGNVKGGTQATVKNLVILNSYIQGSAEGIGSIFGVVYLRPNCLAATATSWQVLETKTEGSYSWTTPVDVAGHDVTRGTIENVYVQSKVSSTGTGRTHTGSAGFVGGNNSELYISNSAWTGTVVGGVRGVAGAVGQIRSLENKGDIEMTKENLESIVGKGEFADWDKSDVAGVVEPDGQLGYYPDHQNSWTVLTNLYLAGHLIGYNGVEHPDAPQSFVGGVIGYANNAGDRIILENIISNSTLDTRVYDAEGNKVYVKVEKNEQPGDLKTYQYLSDTGYVYGGNWGSKNHSSPNPFSPFTYQQWYVDNLTYVETSENILYGRPVGRFVGDTQWYFRDDQLSDEFYAEKFGTQAGKVGEGAKVTKDFNLDGVETNYEMLQYKYGETKVSTTKYWKMQAIGLDGKLLVDANGKPQLTIATVNKKDRTANDAKMLLNYNVFKEYCAVSKEDVGTVEKWNALLAAKGLSDTWTVENGIPMAKSLAEIVKVKEAADVPSATPTVDTTWYANQANETTLFIYNADDLLAFQAEIANGTSFAGKTIAFAGSFAMNTAETKYEIAELADKTFEGTIDGRNHTISGLYLDAAAGNVGLFGNVAAGKKAVVKNLKIDNSSFKAAGDVGVLFGDVAGELEISNVWVNATVEGTANAGAIAGDAAKLVAKNVVVEGTIKGATAGGVVGNTANLTATDVLVTATVANAFAGKGTATVTNALVTSAAAASTGTNVFVVGKDVQANELIGKAGEAFLAAKGMTETWIAVGMNPMPKAVYENFYEGLVGYSVSVGQELALNVYVKLEGASTFEGSFQLGKSKAKKVFSELQDNGLHKFTLENISPDRMMDEITFTTGAYAYKTSVKNYLVALLSVDADLASAMLRWGAAAQKFLDPEVEALVTDGVTGMADAKNTLDGVTNGAAYSGTESEEYKVVATNLIVSEEGLLKVSVKVRFQDISERQCMTAITGDRAEVNLNYSQAEVVEDENRMYTMIYSNLEIASMNDDITLVLKDKPNGTELSSTLTTTLSGIIADFMASDAEQAEKDLVSAMHAVGTAIAAAN